jgi:hypothetical protein
MKKNMFLSFLLFAIVACTNKEEITVANKLGDTVQLKASESISLSDNGSSINLKLINIQDSRCPVNANCIRAGEAIVTLDLQIGDEKFNGLKVCIGCEKEMNIAQSTDIKAKTKTYSIKLNAVNPYPQTTGMTAPTATLVLN